MEKIVDGYTAYSVDENGVVRNIKSGITLSQQTYAGYKKVLLWKDGKSKWHSVHRLVATAFIPNAKNLPCVNHKDEDKLNNSASNLEWCDYQYNNSYGKNAPLKRMKEALIKAVCMYDLHGNLLAEFESAREAQRQTGIWQGNISKCCLGRKHFCTAGGYVWKFKDKMIES